ncbi:formin 1,2/cappuccino, putative [Entamoeba invadens IP1]|uniref:Formin 1,2/cappuccino, putative n=1 Tax=Entamoeba invadens IP1 TaxID=370355 RepID=A0A0A1UFQ3_ENTIV|nr:formin 1,2/cappuccino, putative [Entamoeba invadens IP1]ELP91844.1 formin 1,2/cappuccino, putative [Entamoeba invadens IP1]|eukprot:XP_004258615.1 formin 1,2/cappuccino, putative [Entamoeba invadens IP1]
MGIEIKLLDFYCQTVVSHATVDKFGIVSYAEFMKNTGEAFKIEDIERYCLRVKKPNAQNKLEYIDESSYNKDAIGITDEVQLVYHPSVCAKMLCEQLEETDVEKLKQSLFHMGPLLDDDFVEAEFTEEGGIEQIMSVLLNNEGNIQKYSIQLLRKLMSAKEGLQRIVNNEELVEMLYSLINSSVPSAVSKQAIELVFVVCAYDGFFSFMCAAKSYAKTKAEPIFSNIVQMLDVDELDTQIDILTLILTVLNCAPAIENRNQIITNLKELNIDTKIKNLLKKCKVEELKKKLKEVNAMLSVKIATSTIDYQNLYIDAKKRCSEMETRVTTSDHKINELSRTLDSVTAEKCNLDKELKELKTKYMKEVTLAATAQAKLEVIGGKDGKDKITSADEMRIELKKYKRMYESLKPNELKLEYDCVDLKAKNEEIKTILAETKKENEMLKESLKMQTSLGVIPSDNSTLPPPPFTLPVSVGNTLENSDLPPLPPGLAPPDGMLPPPGLAPPGGMLPPPGLAPPGGLMPPGMLPPPGLAPPGGMMPPPGGMPMMKSDKKNKSVVKPSEKMRPLYWNRVIIDMDTDKSIWKEIKESKLNEKEVNQLFSQKKNATNSNSPAAEEKKVKNKKEYIRLLDDKRYNQLGIIKSRLPKEEVLTDAIKELNTSIINPDLLKTIKDSLLTTEELALFTDVGSETDPTELFFYKLSSIKGVHERLESWYFVLTLNEKIEDFPDQLKRMEDAMNALKSSLCYKKFLGVVISLGNYMNGGNATRGQADGFNIDFLLKLRDVKDNTNTTNMLEYCLKQLTRMEGLPEELSPCKNCVFDLKMIGGQIRSVVKEMENVKRMMAKVVDPNDKGIKTLVSEVKEKEDTVNGLLDKNTQLEERLKEIVLWATGSAKDAQKMGSEEFFGTYKQFVVMVEETIKKLKKVPAEPKQLKTINRANVGNKVADGEDPMAVLIAKIKAGGVKSQLKSTK